MIVNSHNDWDPLEEIIVGRADHSRIATDISARSFSYANFKKEDVEIERSFLEVSSSDYDVSNIPDHINYLPRKQAAEYLGISESTLTRYHLKGKLKWITRRNRTPIYKRETLDNFKEKNKGKLLS